MARSRIQLHNILKGLDGVGDAYFQPRANITMVYPCIVYTRDDSWVTRADNLAYLLHKRYQVTVIDRDPDSVIPDQVESLPYSEFSRAFVSAGLNHFVFNLYF